MRANVAHQPSQALLNAQKELEKRRRLAGVSYRPPRPSSERLLTHPLPASWAESPAAPEAGGAADKPDPRALPSPTAAKVRLAPSLAAHCLDREHRHKGELLDGPYRLYKILQALDRDGRGWLSNSWVEEKLTAKDSAYYIYGRRQLKNILRRGEGLFWQRVKSKGELRIRLVSRLKVAHRLLNDRLRGKEVVFPLEQILGHGRGRQAAVNAAFYSAIHAGRIQPGQEKKRPISRARLRDVSGCSSYRQRQYERRSGIEVTSHVNILGRYSKYKLERARLHQGLPAYKHIDFQGKVNRHRRGAEFVARRLPNSYQTPQKFVVVNSRRQRTMNRELGGLCHMGSEGSDSSDYVRLFHENAAAAVRSFERDPHTIAFFPLSSRARIQLWRSVV